MKQGGHNPSEPEKAAGRKHSTRGARHQIPRRYGAITRAFNAVRGQASCSQLQERGTKAHLLAAIALALMSVSATGTPRVPVILDFGDSLTAGLGLPAAQ